ncbi:MAG TPA: ribonuclease HII [Tenuifilaceae bacterium]|nr:ribonuclease HII [Tenuifilaceae bacterium]
MLKQFHTKGLIEAGCDEAGRGCLAGPVCAAAVVLPPDFYDSRINDSKKLSRKQRDILREVVEHNAIDYAVAMVDNAEIDKINILNAAILAMHKAVTSLTKVKPQHLLIDGNRFKPFDEIPHTCIVGGDGIFLPIAAASILAKTYRDEFMEKLHNDYPMYLWNKNMGYPTKAHRKAIELYGVSPFHRLTFKLLPD